MIISAPSDYRKAAERRLSPFSTRRQSRLRVIRVIMGTSGVGGAKRPFSGTDKGRSLRYRSLHATSAKDWACRRTKGRLGILFKPSARTLDNPR